MNVSDLIGIGKLGGRAGDGYYHVMIKPERRSAITAIKDCYLIFRSDRVFYVTISDIKREHGKWYLKFAEDGIDEERPLHKEVILAVEPDVLKDDENDEMDVLIGYQVVQAGRVIGTVRDYFDNSAHYVLVIDNVNGKEIMIPYVDHYVESVFADLQIIAVRNADPLFDE